VGLSLRPVRDFPDFLIRQPRLATRSPARLACGWSG